MRGLLNEERQMLSWRGPVEDPGDPADDRQRILADRLIAEGRGQFVWERTYDDGIRWVEHQFLRSTATGEKALRIDAIARGLSS